MNKIHVKSIEWAAGLFEGEGCMTTRSRLSLEMTDYDVVKDFADIVGVGNNITQRTRLGCKTSYQWSLSNKQDVRKLLSKFLPFFGSRRAFKALNILDDLELS